jgi:hypothetical protein
MLDRRSVAVINPLYQKRIFEFLGIPSETVGQLFKVPGFKQHNFLVDINQIFAKNPAYGLIDRTGTVAQPVNYHVPRPWRVPTKEHSLDQAVAAIVNDVASLGGMINIMWSGGIDSTLITTAFLKHHQDLSQLRILYSPWSTYEHPEYLNFLKKFPSVELIDISGDVYLNTAALDGVYVVGDGGDESHASLDNSFYNKYGGAELQTNWLDFFAQHNLDCEFLDFCTEFFSRSGRDINTVLEARWWFYISCKFYGTFFETKWPYFFCGYDNFSPDRLISFFDNDHYQNFIYYNTDLIMQGNNYSNWRQFIKDYCCEFDGFKNWAETHKKINSVQVIEYHYKKLALLDRRWLMIESNGNKISTPNLPLFSKLEFDNFCNIEGIFNFYED